MDVLERNYKFYFNIYESCSPSETSAAMFVVQFISFPFSAGAERPVPFVGNYYRKFHSNGKRSR